MKTAKADVNGDFGGRNYPADEALELKPGAHVMFLRNDADQRWVNGTLGIVRGHPRHRVGQRRR